MKTSIFEKLKSKKKRLQRLKEKIIKFYSEVPESELTDEHKEVCDYLKTNEINVFPYSFIEKYQSSGIEIFKDKTLGLNYMLWNGKKIYCKEEWSVKKAQRNFNNFLIEQDVQSPHRYLSNDFDVRDNNIVVDVGAAEGIFGISVIEKISKLYVFEPDEKWIKPLEATFNPWKEKVHIIQKAVSDINDMDFVTLDQYFKGNETIDFLKVDVEGMEERVLRGAQNVILNQEHSRLAICTYHKQEDASSISSLLAEYGYRISYSNGFMIYYYGKDNIVKEPYLRRGVLRAFK